MLDHVEDFFPILIQLLSDPAKEVVELDLRVLATVSSSAYLCRKAKQGEAMAALFPTYNAYFYKFMINLLELFRRDLTLRFEKGSAIIK